MTSRTWRAQGESRSREDFILVTDNCVMVQIGRRTNDLGDRSGWIASGRYWLRAAQLALRPMVSFPGTGAVANDNMGGTNAGRTGTAAREFGG